MLKKFGKRFKDYFSYLMTVDFKELFINVIILLCILLLSSFVFVPVGLVESLIRDFIFLFITLDSFVLQLYNWLFDLIATLGSVYAFIILFNKRFEDIEAFKKQVKGKPQETKVQEETKKDDELELPKTKEKEKAKIKMN